MRSFKQLISDRVDAENNGDHIHDLWQWPKRPIKGRRVYEVACAFSIMTIGLGFDINISYATNDRPGAFLQVGPFMLELFSWRAS
jgi:hypothetical protein